MMLSDDKNYKITVSTLDIKRIACLIEDEYDKVRTLSESVDISLWMRNYLDDEAEHLYKLKQKLFDHLNDLWESEE